MKVEKNKCRVAVLFGGPSSEYEVSLRSAASVIKSLNRDLYEVVPIGISKTGQWVMHDVNALTYDDAGAINFQTNAMPLEFTLGDKSNWLQWFDVVFPAVHGTCCEDGSLQGFLELLGVPYVGAGVSGSAIGMDKVISKRLVQGIGVPVSPWISINSQEWQLRRNEVFTSLQETLSLPLFVKPANTGSSVGISKVTSWAQLTGALDEAFRYDFTAIVEKGINAREIEVSVLENVQDFTHPLVSFPGEVKPTHEFYSYEAKYLDENGAYFDLPANLPLDVTHTVQTLAKKIFLVLNCQGMARVDFLLDRDTGICYFNEVNTLPGFTSISLYPKMWETSGLAYPELLTRLITIALQRRDQKNKLLRDWMPEQYTLKASGL